MEINVRGTGKILVKPDMVELNIEFLSISKTYNDVLNMGVNSVDKFINEVLYKVGFKKEDLKTRSFVISEDTRYDRVSDTYVKNGFKYRQEAIIRFKYDMELLGKMMELISLLDSELSYHVNFTLSNELDVRDKVFKLAYLDALSKVEAICKASNRRILECIRIDNNNEVSELYSGTRFCSSEVSSIVSTFTPDDIEIKETLNCLFKA